jgi:hypothetical protein
VTNNIPNTIEAKKQLSGAHARAQRLALFKKDLAWLRTRVNAHSDPVVRGLITQIENEIAAIERGGR